MAAMKAFYENATKACIASIANAGLTDMLEHLLHQLDNNPDVEGRSAIGTAQFIASSLERRVAVEQLMDSEKVQNVKLDDPVVLISFTRTGSTLLQRLLAEDKEAFYAITLRDMNHISRLNERNDTEDDRYNKKYKEQDHMHELNLDYPEEMQFLQELFLLNCLWKFQFFESETYRYCQNSPRSNSIFTCREFWKTRTKEFSVAMYKYCKGIFQIIALNRKMKPNQRFLCKFHVNTGMFDVDAFMEVFPRATLIATHRDMLETVGSTASLFEFIVKKSRRISDLTAFGHAVLDDLHYIAERHAEERINYTETKVHTGQRASPFVDVMYTDLMDKPMVVLKTLYDQMGLEWSDNVEDLFQRYLANNPKGKHGKHDYTCSKYGLTVDTINAAFPLYKKLFNL